MLDTAAIDRMLHAETSAGDTLSMHGGLLFRGWVRRNESRARSQRRYAAGAGP
jgi:hypothetical protein